MVTKSARPRSASSTWSTQYPAENSSCGLAAGSRQAAGCQPAPSRAMARWRWSDMSSSFLGGQRWPVRQSSHGAAGLWVATNVAVIPSRPGSSDSSISSDGVGTTAPSSDSTGRSWRSARCRCPGSAGHHERDDHRAGQGSGRQHVEEEFQQSGETCLVGRRRQDHHLGRSDVVGRSSAGVGQAPRCEQAVGNGRQVDDGGDDRARPATALRRAHRPERLRRCRVRDCGFGLPATTVMRWRRLLMASPGPVPVRRP